MEKEIKKKILIVEDEQQLVELLSAKLIKEGYDVEAKYDGEDGLMKIRSWKPDLILLDIMMPKVDGYGVLMAMNEENIKIPVIVISNSGQPVEIEKTKKLGAVDHLIKTDFSPTDVLKKVNSYLSGGAAASFDESVLNPVDGKIGSKGLKVLLVEDDSFLGEICSKKLVKEEYTVYRAVDGMQALEGAKAIKPDIILLDIILPAIDGFQILGEIRRSKDKKLATVPIIMLSNLGQDDDVKKATEMGATGYMVKAHFTTDEIANKVKTVLGK
ncbi:response regulator [Candidatus Parcubacteria bacterium]|nr:response regulator [Patescibacteria group bacterium]MBU4308889.1 response regulator [Patescibacteria group bacterium]MBU4432728.1 response regulator [Patescibacteria group bacterium]MBU4577249.1 response regulator [Patescibacteria group bacterium]MCG2696940.1 response regulator [Candidatus Parcubacteria bacterium]